MISIADRVGHSFHLHTVAAGFAAWFKGDVSVTHESERALFVNVKTKRPNDVRLVVEAGQLLVSCSCAAKSLGTDVCKHLWAALLEADKRGAFPSLRVTRARLAIAPLVPEDERKLTQPEPRARRRPRRKRKRSSKYVRPRPA